MPYLHLDRLRSAFAPSAEERFDEEFAKMGVLLSEKLR